MDLRSLIANRKQQLKSCTTVVTNTDGSKYEMCNGETKELENGLPFVVDTKPDLEVAQVMPGLFLGSQDPAVSVEILKQYDIRHILSVGIDLSVKFEGITYDHINLLDLPECEIMIPLESCFGIINNHRHENVFVHCNAGVSRSPTVIIAYLMAEQNISFDEAYDQVKRVRRCIRPNDGFIRQLKTFELRKRQSANKVCEGL